MNSELTYHLLQTLRQGTERLGDEALLRICQFVKGQRMSDEAFMNRRGQADLYYTMFGWMLCYALSIPSDRNKRKSFLKTIDTERLDTLHQTVLTLCYMLDKLLSLPSFTPDAILKLMADDKPLQQFFESYQQHGSGIGTNAWAAKSVMTTEGDAALLTGKILSMQHESGGFLAHEGVAMPDMLSTAVALFALQEQGISPRYDATPFIEAHWLEDGSFVATLLDHQSDVEYVFYGLLSLGSL